MACLKGVQTYYSQGGVMQPAARLTPLNHAEFGQRWERQPASTSVHSGVQLPLCARVPAHELNDRR
jgi:hypothetical protein